MYLIKVYSKAGCAPCTMTKRVLGRGGVAFEELDSTQNIEYLQSQGHMSAPVVEVWDDDSLVEAWNGFHPDRLESFINTVKRG